MPTPAEEIKSRLEALLEVQRVQSSAASAAFMLDQTEEERAAGQATPSAPRSERAQVSIENVNKLIDETVNEVVLNVQRQNVSVSPEQREVIRQLVSQSLARPDPEVVNIVIGDDDTRFNRAVFNAISQKNEQIRAFPGTITFGQRMFSVLQAMEAEELISPADVDTIVRSIGARPTRGDITSFITRLRGEEEDVGFPDIQVFQGPVEQQRIISFLQNVERSLPTIMNEAVSRVRRRGGTDPFNPSPGSFLTEVSRIAFEQDPADIRSGRSIFPTMDTAGFRRSAFREQQLSRAFQSVDGKQPNIEEGVAQILDSFGIPFRKEAFPRNKERAQAAQDLFGSIVDQLRRYRAQRIENTAGAISEEALASEMLSLAELYARKPDGGQSIFESQVDATLAAEQRQQRTEQALESAAAQQEAQAQRRAQILSSPEAAVRQRLVLQGAIDDDTTPEQEQFIEENIVGPVARRLTIASTRDDSIDPVAFINQAIRDAIPGAQEVTRAAVPGTTGLDPDIADQRPGIDSVATVTEEPDIRAPLEQFFELEQARQRTADIFNTRGLREAINRQLREQTEIPVEDRLFQAAEQIVPRNQALQEFIRGETPRLAEEFAEFQEQERQPAPSQQRQEAFDRGLEQGATPEELIGARSAAGSLPDITEEQFLRARLPSLRGRFEQAERRRTQTQERANLSALGRFRERLARQQQDIGRQQQEEEDATAERLRSRLLRGTRTFIR